MTCVVPLRQQITTRWVVYDAKRHGVKLRDEVWTTLQERAYNSPTWYTP